MLCKICGKPVEPGYESTGKCEDCSTKAWAHLSNDAYENGPRPDTMSRQEVLALHISELELSARTTNYLSNMGIDFIRDLIKRSEAELMEIRNFGDAALKEIKNGLQALGLSLQ